jgi:hypothetical protein
VILETVANNLLDQLHLHKFEPLPVVNKKQVPVMEWVPQSGAYDNIVNGIQRTLNNLPANKGPYSGVGDKLRSLYIQARFDELFNEIDHLESFMRSRDVELLNIYQTLRKQWKKVKLDEIRRAKNYEENSHHFSYELIDFITLLEKVLSEKD